MQWRLKIILLSAAFVGLGGGVGWYFLQPPKAVGICEEILTDSLKSPSSYKRVRYVVGSYLIEKRNYVDAYMNSHLVKGTVLNPESAELDRRYAQAVVDSKDYNAKMITVKISYDAANAYGASLRGEYLCGFLDTDDQGEAKKMNLAVAGELSN